MNQVESWREALLAGGREAGPDALLGIVLGAFEEQLPVLEDADLREVAQAASAANIAVAVDLIRGSLALAEYESPPQAVAFARELARRNVPVAELARAYRVAEIALWRWGVDELRRRLPPDRLGDAIQAMSEATFATGHVLSAAVIERYAVERERWIRSADAIRSATVEELLAGAPVDAAAASTRLRYELGQEHQAFVVWTEGDDDVPEHVAAAVGGQRGLLVRMGIGVVAGWSPAGSTDADAATGVVSVALGTPGRGVDGFRASHHEAMEARRVAQLVGSREPTRYADVALLALLTKDLRQARAFAFRKLGSLTEADEAMQRLADTFLVALEEQGSLRRAARRLGVHENTVAKRLRSVYELVPDAADQDPAELMAALLILRAARESTNSPSSGSRSMS